MAIVNGYATLTEIKGRLGISDAADDAALEAAIEAASRFIDGYCGRRFYSTSTDETRYYTAWHPGRLLLGDDLLSITTLATDGDGDRVYEETWATTDYDLLPDNAALDGEPYWEITTTPDGGYSFPAGVAKGVKIVGKFGYCLTASPPRAIVEACLLRATQVFRLKDVPFATIGGDGAQTTVSVPVYGMIRDLLGPFRRLGVG